MPTFTALTSLVGEDAATALADAIEKLVPEPTGVGVFEIEDDSGLWEVGAYFVEPPDLVMLEVLALAFSANFRPSKRGAFTFTAAMTPIWCPTCWPTATAWPC